MYTPASSRQEGIVVDIGRVGQRASSTCAILYVGFFGDTDAVLLYDSLRTRTNVDTISQGDILARDAFCVPPVETKNPS